MVSEKRGLNTLEGIAIITGTVIGAGVLGIPYVVARAGFLTGLIDILVLGFVVMLTFLYFGEVVLRTKGAHQLTGYAEKYLGKWGKGFMGFAMIFGGYGALIAYIIGEGQAWSALVSGPPALYSILFFIAGSTLVYFGLKAIAKSELFMGGVVLVVLLAIIVLTIPHINHQNLISFNADDFFVPYGAILFAFMGAVSVVEAKEELVDKKKLKKCIMIGCLIPLIAYLIFTFVVVGAISLDLFQSLAVNERIATIALIHVVGYKIAAFGNLFAVFAMATSFLAIGLAVKEMYMYDFRLRKNLAFLLTILPPFIIAMLGFTNFIQAVSIAGVISGGIESTLIILMFFQAKKMGDREPEYSMKPSKLLATLMILLFIAGVVFLLI